MNFTTHSGHHIQFTRVGDGYDVRTMNAAGETISSVWLDTEASRDLMAKLEA